MRNILLAFALLLVTPQIRWDKMPTIRKQPAFSPNIERAMLREGRRTTPHPLDPPMSSRIIERISTAGPVTTAGPDRLPNNAAGENREKLPATDIDP